VLRWWPVDPSDKPAVLQQQERPIASLRTCLAARGQALARSEEKRRTAEADVEALRLRATEAEAALAEREAVEAEALAQMDQAHAEDIARRTSLHLAEIGAVQEELDNLRAGQSAELGEIERR